MVGGSLVCAHCRNHTDFTTDLSRADRSIIADLSHLVPMYEELAVSETKAAFLQSVVSSILVEMIFDAYFIGLTEEQATQLGQLEKRLVHLSTYDAWLVLQVL